MKVFGLIGYPLEHSFSPAYFATKFLKEGIADSAYKLFPLENIGLFPALLKNHPEISGLNVTIPYKKSIISYLDKLDPVAAKLGAVNTIKIHHGVKVGYNTDVEGFMQAYKNILVSRHKNALVLGTGGAAMAVCYALEQMRISSMMVSRVPSVNQIRYEDIDATVLQKYTVIVNTSPLGMLPHLDSFPLIPYHLLSSAHLLIDLVYNPSQTVFLEKGVRQTTQTVNGLKMLQLQAEASWKIWTLESGMTN